MPSGAEFSLADGDALEWEIGRESQSTDSEVDTMSDDGLVGMYEMYGSHCVDEDISD
ncbi:hypothetical protein PISMIDRAFT_17677 [Pisolithus microcarpus 441]|uniref:Uncharacterized protein n=1 Tax=Pisolithus microcarpus 441 TaxID=765257 RepID=A0A0C9YAL3_9AGAM|nr:hypothetical protein PISMIDRAFT_17677 [Pisolithus microcarpus 441]